MNVDIVYSNGTSQFKLEDLYLVPCNGVYYFCWIRRYRKSNYAMGGLAARGKVHMVPLWSEIYGDDVSEFRSVVDNALVTQDEGVDLLQISTIMPIDAKDPRNGHVSLGIGDIINKLNKFNKERRRGSR